MREKLIELLDGWDCPILLAVCEAEALADYLIENGVTVRKKGEWILTAHEENCNCRWNVTAECSECHLDKGEIWAGFFLGFPKKLAEDVALDSAKSVKLDNYCSHCGADMRGEEHETD